MIGHVQAMLLRFETIDEGLLATAGQSQSWH